MPGGVAPKFGSEKVSRYTGVSQLQLRVSRYTVQVIVKQFGSGKELSLDAAFLLTVGSLLLTVELFYLQLTSLAFLLAVGAFLLTILAYLLTIGAFLLTVVKYV